MYTEEQMQIQRFFALLFGKANGGYVELRPTNYAGSPDMEKRKWIPANEQEEFAKAALELKGKYHVYFGVATRTEEGKEKGKGTSQYLKELPCLYADLDGDDYDGGMAEARDRLESFCPPPSIVVLSGHGFHGYWLLDKPYDLSQSHAKPQTLLKALQVKELEADPTYDLARLLRVMNTTNIKNPEKLVLAKPKKMTNLRYSIDELAKELPWKEVVEEDYDRDKTGGGLTEGKYIGLEKVVNSDFIQYCRKHATDLSEPLWYAMITNLIPFKNEGKTGREVIHILSRPYPQYSKFETDKKVQHALADAPGPHTVEFIKEHGFHSKDCEEAGVKSPAGLAFVDNDEKEESGVKNAQEN